MCPNSSSELTYTFDSLFIDRVTIFILDVSAHFAFASRAKTCVAFGLGVVSWGPKPHGRIVVLRVKRNFNAGAVSGVRQAKMVF